MRSRSGAQGGCTGRRTLGLSLDRLRVGPVEAARTLCDSLRMRTIVLTVAGTALGVVAYRVQIHDLHSPRDRAIATLAYCGAFLVAGIAAWARRPANRLGQLMVVTGFALLARQLRYSHDPAAFTVFFLLGDLPYALVGHCVFAYPFGRIRGRAERALVVAGYATASVFPLAVLLLHDRRSPLLQDNPLDPRPHKSLLHLATSGHAVELLQKSEVVVFFGVLATLFIVLIARNLLRATPRMRVVLLPLVVAAITFALRAVFESVFTFFDRPFAYDYVFWWQAGAIIALPLALLAGLLRARLARGALGELLLALERTSPAGLRDALAHALGDPTLELAFWLPERNEFVDDQGTALPLPADDSPQALTPIEHQGEPVAALVHDRSLLEEPELVQAAGAAARLALENARLQAELRVQLKNVEESRARVVAAGDEERRRIERDLHDGAQQRLVAIAIKLRRAQRRLGSNLDPAVEDVLETAVDELQVAVEELRKLAQGIHPTILAEGGLSAALDSLAGRSSLPVQVEATTERFPPDIEAAAYFVACEALANVVKHADAAGVSVAARRRNGTLVIEVADDGVGGARLDRGSGLRGLADRLEARGGRLRVETPDEGGTRVIGEIPCAS
jgi:signal transduction histidine kinase